MPRRRVWVAAALALLVLAAATALAIRGLRPLDLATYIVSGGRVAVQVQGPGTVQARVPVTLAARITATVTRVDADVGDTVRRGQVLAWLDSRDLQAKRLAVDGQRAALARNTQAAQAAVERARAELELARVKQRRDAELLRTGFVSPAVLDSSDAGLQAARANLESALANHAARQADAQVLAQEAQLADAQLSYARLSAPMDGVVIARLVEAGSVVTAGVPILRIVDPAGLWVATRVDESMLARVREGQPARIRLRSGETLAGKVARIARQSDAATREIEVHVAFDQPPERFAIDQEAQVTIATGELSGLVVPVGALSRDAQGHQGLWVVDDGRARWRPVRTGAGDERQVLVTEGLAAGERIVVDAQQARAGTRLRNP